MLQSSHRVVVEGDALRALRSSPPPQQGFSPADTPYTWITSFTNMDFSWAIPADPQLLVRGQGCQSRGARISSRIAGVPSTRRSRG